MNTYEVRPYEVCTLSHTMPAKNIVKTYIEDGFYHIYNRGVEKRNIFIDQQDYKVFCYFLDLYLLPKEDSINRIKKLKNISDYEKDKKISQLFLLKNFYGKIEVLAYALKPNHIHFEIKQKEKNSMESFMQSMIVKYVKYFNKKYDRVGPLFQGRYKAVLIEKEEYLLYLSCYIHLNARNEVDYGNSLDSYPWSSYKAYLGGNCQKWLNTKYILSYFRQKHGYGFNSYRGFVEGYKLKSVKDIGYIDY